MISKCALWPTGKIASDAGRTPSRRLWLATGTSIDRSIVRPPASSMRAVMVASSGRVAFDGTEILSGTPPLPVASVARWIGSR